MSKTRRSFAKPYTFRGRMICIVLLFSLVAMLISSACSYLISRVVVRNEFASSESDAAISLLELEQKTDLPLETLLQMAASSDITLEETSAEAAKLTQRQLRQLEEHLTLSVTSGFADLPVTYVLLSDKTLVRIMPASRVNIFLLAGLRFVFVGFTFTAIFVLFALLSAQISARPVSMLTGATRQLAEGDFSVRLPEDRPGEMGELMRSFNTMAAKLSRTAYLQKDFISSISHEFKTPIASIKGYARLLQMSGLPEDERTEYVNMIAEESDRLSRMSQTLLRLASLEEQLVPATVSAFRLDEQVRQVIVQLAPAWENHNIDWQLELSPVTIESDEELLRQVWINLIQNAVKFSNDGGSICISVYEAGEAVVEVADHGIGMDEETVSRIFDRFYQADPSRSREGVGLGLCLVKRIADILGGVIRVRSTPGQGSIFRVRLPLKAADRPNREEKQHGQ